MILQGIQQALARTLARTLAQKARACFTQVQSKRHCLSRATLFTHNQYAFSSTINNGTPINRSSTLLRADKDDFRNVHFHKKQFASCVDVEDFKRALSEAIAFYASAAGGANAVWVHLPPEYLHYSDACAKAGLKMHHATPKELVLCAWIDATAPNKVPPYCSYYVASGAAVVNAHNEILLVQEAAGRRKDLWGIPSGLCAEGESLQLSAERELVEETGLVGKVHDLLLVREVSGSPPGDIYFVFLVRLDAQRQQTVKLDLEEVKDYAWAPLATVHELVRDKKVVLTQADTLMHIQALHKSGYRFYEDRLIATGG